MHPAFPFKDFHRLKVGYDVDWSVQLQHGAEIGLGSRDYELIQLE